MRAAQRSRMVIAILALLVAPRSAVTGQQVAIRGLFHEPWPELVRVHVLFGERKDSCVYRPSSSGSGTLCTVSIPAEYARVRVELDADNCEPWTKNMFRDGDTLDLGQIQIRKAPPRGLLLRAARVMPKKNSRQFVIETEVENLTDGKIPLRNLVIDAAEDWGIMCREGERTNDWQEIHLDWAFLRSDSKDGAQAAWTTVHDDTLRVGTEFRQANCGDYHHRLKVTIPLTLDVQPRTVERLFFRVLELNARNVKLPPLATWDSLAVTLETAVDGFPAIAKYRMR